MFVLKNVKLMCLLSVFFFLSKIIIKYIYCIFALLLISILLLKECWCWALVQNVHMLKFCFDLCGRYVFFLLFPTGNGMKVGRKNS
jgi:hypothetical protein